MPEAAHRVARGLILLGLVGTLALTAPVSTAPALAAPAALIQAGIGIGPIKLGMPVAEVAPTLKLQATPRLAGDRVVYDYAKVGLTVWARDDRVVRVATRNPFHSTPTGVGPGQPWNEGLVSVCRGAALIAETARGFEVTCTLAGIAFEVAGSTLAAIAVFRPGAR
jgi:hypothetical protein